MTSYVTKISYRINEPNTDRGRLSIDCHSFVTTDDPKAISQGDTRISGTRAGDFYWSLEGDASSAPMQALGFMLENRYGLKLSINSKVSADDADASFVSLTERSGLRLDGWADDGFGAQLEKVKTALRSLSEYLRGINDPELLTVELKTARSYIDASLCFLDEKRYLTGGPAEMPAEITKGVTDQLEKVDNFKISGEAREWAKFALEFLKAWWKAGS